MGNSQEVGGGSTGQSKDNEGRAFFFQPMTAEKFCTGQSKDNEGRAFLFQPMTVEQFCTSQSKDNQGRSFRIQPMTAEQFYGGPIKRQGRQIIPDPANDSREVLHRPIKRQ